MKIGTDLSIQKLPPLLEGYRDNVPDWVELKAVPLLDLRTTRAFSNLINFWANKLSTLRGMKGYYTLLHVFKPDKPWVCVVEDACYLYMKTLEESNKNLVQKNCKKILPWSYATKESLKLFNYEKFENKVEVVYPSIRDSGFKRSGFEKKEIINLLFVTKGTLADGLNKFHAKGGKEVLKAFEVLCTKYDLHLYMVGTIPVKVLRKYRNYRNITFIKDTKTRDYLYRHLYPKADIYVMPSSIDSFGFVFLEAMNYGLPILASNCRATPEIVEEGKGGFLIEPKFSQFNQKHDPCNIDPIRFYDHAKYFEYYNKVRKTEVPQIIRKLSVLIEDSQLRRKMSKHNRKLVTEGKFSTKYQENTLKVVFEYAFAEVGR